MVAVYSHGGITEYQVLDTQASGSITVSVIAVCASQLIAETIVAALNA